MVGVAGLVECGARAALCYGIGMAGQCQDVDLEVMILIGSGVRMALGLM